MEPEDGHSPLVWCRWCFFLLSMYDTTSHSTMRRSLVAGDRQAAIWILSDGMPFPGYGGSQRQQRHAPRTAAVSPVIVIRVGTLPPTRCWIPLTRPLSHQPDREMDGTFLLLRHPRHCWDEGGGRRCSPPPRPLARSLTLRDEK